MILYLAMTHLSHYIGLSNEGIGMSECPNEDIVVADKSARKRFLIALVLITAAAAVLTYYLSQHIERLKILAAADPDLAMHGLVRLMRIVLLAGVLLACLVGASLIRTALRTLRAGRFPPPGMRVIRDTRVVTGARARIQAITLMVVAVIFIAAQFLLLFYVPGVLERLQPRRSQQRPFQLRLAACCWEPKRVTVMGPEARSGFAKTARNRDSC